MSDDVSAPAAAPRGEGTLTALDREASEWVAQVAMEPSAGNIEAARKWCEQSADHRAAFERARWLWTAADRVPVRAASSRRRRFVRYAAAAGLIGVVCAAWLALGSRADYSNAGSAPRRIELADRSTMFLDASSAVDVHFSRERRDIELLKGAAFFEVAHDRQRPFVVHGLGVTATAVGTVYAVRRQEDAVVVTVKQGIVRMDDGTGRSLELRAGQQATARPKGAGSAGSARLAGSTEAAGSPSTVDIDRALAWQRGRLAFDRTPLIDMVAELNRYRRGYVIVMDSSIKALPVSGVFRVDRADDVLQTLEQALHIRVRRLTDYIVLLDRLPN